MCLVVITHDRSTAEKAHRFIERKDDRIHRDVLSELRRMQIMKVLVISDVHGNKRRLKDVLSEVDAPDYVLSLGDQELKQSFLQSRDIIAIKGNAAFDSGSGFEQTVKINGWRIYMTHGHKLRVQNSYDRLYYRMLEEEADIAMHGHTHQMAFMEVSGKFIVNPGSLNQSRDNNPESFLIMDMQEDHVALTWYDFHAMDVIGSQTIKR